MFPILPKNGLTKLMSKFYYFQTRSFDKQVVNLNHTISFLSVTYFKNVFFKKLSIIKKILQPS